MIPNSATSVQCNVESFDSNGNTQVVSSITAITRDVTDNTDTNSFTYSNGYGANCASSKNTNGSRAFAAAGKVGSSCSQLRMWLTYTGKVYDQPPSTPSNLAPSGNANSLTPTFTGSFSDPTSGDTLGQYEIEVQSASGGGGSQLWDTGNVNASSSETSNAAFSRVYAGSALSYGTTYSFRARVANQNGNWSSWSGWVNFTPLQGPNAPSSIAPNGPQSGQTPTFGFTYTHPASTAMASYHYTLYDAGSGATVYNSGTVTQSVASGASVTGNIPSAAGLQYGGAYLLQIVAVDSNGVSSPIGQASFSITSLPTVSAVSPINGATAGTQTPTFTWQYTAGSNGYTQGQYQVQVINRTTGASIWDSGVVSSAASSAVSGVSIAYNTQISWRVQCFDTAGNATGYTPYAAAIVNNTPQANITSPANNSSILTATPTVTWTYTASASGKPQASAQVLLSDANGNLLQTYSVSGAGTSYTLPVGVLQNTYSYQLVVKVTDTGAVVGQSATITFTLSYAAPADMQGQPLASNKNWLLAPYLNEDSGNGVALDWQSQLQAGVAGTFSVDPTIVQPFQLASGDGPVTGAQRVAYNGASSGVGSAIISQNINLSTTNWVAGTTVLSLSAYALLAIIGGSPYAFLNLKCFSAINAGGSQLSSASSANQADTAGAFARMSLANVLIPAGTLSVQVLLRVNGAATTDLATAWFFAAQLEANATVDANFISGDLGTGYSYDTNGYSVRTALSGNLPTLAANPGADTDPVSASGGSITFGWDTTLADTRFVAYLIERRRQDSQGDDTEWLTLATITNKQVNSFTDYTPGGNTTYQYSVRQQIAYSGGGVGLSAHRAIVVGSVSFSPAWYLTNAGQLGAPINNVRLTAVAVQRKLAWKETATYTQYIGRVGTARDSGQPAGYVYSLVCYFDDTFGDDRQAVRRQFVSMQRLQGVWYLKDPEGLVLPLYIQDIDFDETDTGSDTLLTVTLSLLQAQDTQDY